MERTLGGERLGGGKKMKVQMRNYERSTHDLSRAWRSSMSAGTIVPFLKEVALPGDTFDIDLECQVLTLPTVGPLYGSYQVQLDVFITPIRLYNAKLHMNQVGLGMKMETVHLPRIQIRGRNVNVGTADLDNAHINPSSLLKYLGISGLGYQINPDGSTPAPEYAVKRFNAVPFLIYWDKYKNYYANKMEKIGAMIHKQNVPDGITLTTAQWFGGQTSPETLDVTDPYTETQIEVISTDMWVIIELNTLTNAVPLEALQFGLKPGTDIQWRPVTHFFENWQYDEDNNRLIGSGYKYPFAQPGAILSIWGCRYNTDVPFKDGTPTITTFPLENIDKMKMEILKTDEIVTINHEYPGYAPYSNVLDGKIDEEDATKSVFATEFTQEGLALRTYKSDLFNNWIDTEFISGPDGISEVTRVGAAGSGFTIDELNLNKKVYDMLNRIAMSGGTYDDWLDATYTEDRQRSAETPMYMGGLIQNLIFQEITSTAQTAEAPLGQLAGRGRTGDFHKGGKVVIKVEEPSYITGNISIVPNIDYSQGNDWDVYLKTINDLHKPALDEIGFQDLITSQMAWWDASNISAETTYFQSAGKQPAWINYMTAVNKVYGTFADQTQQMFMVLNRRYQHKWETTVTEPNYEHPTIADLTTYVDPSKFNHIFADTRLDAQNFWVQIGIGIEARRKMSAKIIPNL